MEAVWPDATVRRGGERPSTEIANLRRNIRQARCCRARRRMVRTGQEAGQARYLSELLEMFETEGVDSAFVFLFALAGYPHRPDGDPRDDLDRAGLGIVKLLEGGLGQTYPDMEWNLKPPLRQWRSAIGDDRPC